jgi:hypothetical protein
LIELAAGLPSIGVPGPEGLRRGPHPVVTMAAMRECLAGPKTSTLDNPNNEAKKRLVLDQLRRFPLNVN